MASVGILLGRCWKEEFRFCWLSMYEALFEEQDKDDLEEESWDHELALHL